MDSSQERSRKSIGVRYTGRKDKKPMYHQIWMTRINAAVRPHGLTYSTFMHKLSQNNIEMNRKVLADLAMNNPAAFEAIVNKVK
ncbi:MAG: 50S ribosomal protein L20 [Chitinophagales bacterium]